MESALPIVLGADIGGSHITTALINLQTKSVLKETMHRLHVDSKADAASIIGTWATAMQHSLANMPAEGMRIGIAMPGPFDYDKGTCLMKGNDKYASLYGMNVKHILADALFMDASNIHIANDAACFIKGESVAGDAAKYTKLIGVTLGTGLGTSFLHAAHVEDCNLWCMPFKDGIAEDYTSTRWFVKRCKELSGNDVKGVREMVETQDNEMVVAIFNEFADHLAVPLSLFAQMKHPQAVVLGGNLMHNSKYFMHALQQKVNNLYGNLPLLPAVLGEDAIMIGAVVDLMKD